ncbi:hypothetical protein NE237_022575 [Protea cynaroides]|uniref:Retrotransposon gag domain-containing protein n=1 Tax=Protea cynaroides TaxID=273540 RepID=A0A9Q0HCB3_9MAGN|nr:hypothetical protein NE237_022575 [Protea cynaroides]
MDIFKEHKVICATQVCKGEANTWWKAAKKILGANGHKPIWKEFVKAFEQEYFLPCYKRMKETECLNLRQGTMTLQEYAKKFDECAKFAGNYVDTKEKRARQFEEGLKEDIRVLVKTFQLITYAEVLKKAQIVEFDKRKEKAPIGKFLGKDLWRGRVVLSYPNSEPTRMV